MKYLTILLAAGSLSFASHAQNGFYLTPSAGIGLTNGNLDFSYVSSGSGSEKPSSILGYKGQIGIGYQYKNWRFLTGVQYLKTGYERDHLLMADDFDPGNPNPVGSGYLKLEFHHLSIPLQAGYTFFSESRFHLVPYAGVAASYNLGARSTSRSKTQPTTSGKMPDDAFSASYNKLSLWGLAAAYGEYRLSDQISIFGGPSVQYMLTNFAKAPTSSVIFKTGERNYAFLLDLGVNIRLL